MTDNLYSPGPSDRTVRSSAGVILTVPVDWQFVCPGDAALTRRIKAAGDHWIVQERRGRRIFTKGIWTSSAMVQQIQEALSAERSTESFAKRKVADAKRREKTQTVYVEDFTVAVTEYLAFHPRYAALASRMARAISDHATPVGSGTVARTKRIPVEQRAAAAVIAWMRHQTTAYDSMQIPRIRGKRREVRRMLAAVSRDLLSCYRRGDERPESCPLFTAPGQGSVSDESPGQRV